MGAFAGIQRFALAPSAAGARGEPFVRWGTQGDMAMPRLAANLGFLFQEVGFFDRFDAAARAGFRAVEHGSPYEAPPEDLAARLQACGLQQVLCNLPPGDRARGERGVAALPGREEVFAKCVEQALTYAKALSSPCLHAMAGTPPAGRGWRRNT